MIDVKEEIERLRAKKLEIAAKISMTNDFDEKEELKEKIEKIEKQIKTLEELL